MIQWLESKALLLLLAALVVGGGLFAVQTIRLTTAQSKLELSEINLGKATTQAALVTQVFANYQAAVAKDKASYDALQQQIATVSKGVSDVNTKVKAYKPTAILDDPWPDDFIRLRGQAPTPVPANAASGKSNKDVPSSR